MRIPKRKQEVAKALLGGKFNIGDHVLCRHKTGPSTPGKILATWETNIDKGWLVDTKALGFLWCYEKDLEWDTEKTSSKR